MPTLISHPATPIALSFLAGKRQVSFRLLLVGILLSVLPDADVISFRLGIPYASPWGHRGFSHSLLFASLVPLLFLPFSRSLRTKRLFLYFFAFFSLLSHTLLDAMTNGGLGVGLFLPFSQERFFFSYRPIQVSPISLSRFFSSRGEVVLLSEIYHVWLPLLGGGFVGMALRYLARFFRGGRRGELARERVRSDG